MDNNKSIGVYIHVPFCKSKCYYCDFNSYSGREYLAGSYFNALFNEIEIRGKFTEDRCISSVFIGGGTPSLVVPGYISSLLDVCSKYMRLDKNAEISMESNPGTLTYDRLKAYRAAGVNRLSIGLQAWQDRLLKIIGRIHDRRQFIDNLDASVRAGFDNINADLMFGLPQQTMEDWAETIDEIAKPGPIKHISCYSLKIEKGTVFGERLEAGTLQLTDDELDRQMYHYAVEKLADRGLKQYEISNFAMPGYECRHNLIYWRAREYVGFGAGSHSFLDSVRYNNTVGIEEYIKAVDHICPGAYNPPGMGNGAEGVGGHGEGKVPNLTLHENFEVIGRNEAMSEYMILGLRLNEGIDSAEFEERFGEKLENVYGRNLDKLVDKGLIAADRSDLPGRGVKYSLTALGSDIANSVFIEFI